MDNCKWTIAELILAFVVLSVCQLDDREETIETSVWVGEEANLKCGDNSSDAAFRFWKKEDEILILGNGDIVDEDRISLVNWSAILTISNVTLADGGQYTCTVYTVPRLIRTTILRIKVMPCVAPKNPLNGGYESDRIDADEGYKLNDTIRYYCDSGFELVGVALRQCTGSPKGWTDQKPYCEPRYITELRQRLDKLEDKIATVNNTVVMVDNTIQYNRMTTKENNVSNIDSRITNANVVLSSIFFLTSGIDFVKKQMSKAGQLATVGFKDGSLVSEFAWTVKNIEEETTKAKGKKDHYIESNEFYTNVPGYRAQLFLYPNRSNSGFVGLYVELLEGEFDNILPWPFSNRYEFTSVAGNGSLIVSVSLVPNSSLACTKAYLKPPANTILCGTSTYIETQTLLSNKDEYLIDGGLNIKATFW